MLDHSVNDPGRYADEIRIMRALGWSWIDLQSAPADLVEELAIRLSAESHWQSERLKLDARKAK